MQPNIPTKMPLIAQHATPQTQPATEHCPLTQTHPLPTNCDLPSTAPIFLTIDLRQYSVTEIDRPAAPKPAVDTRPVTTKLPIASALKLTVASASKQVVAPNPPKPAVAPSHGMLTRGKTGHLKAFTFSATISNTEPQSYSQVQSQQ
ncbi:unnamed protein product [Dovyalis caffra]|uniref:Uncharacterized protein n=1 Tax=Dovyalis caffra TaxID=77055 RepID=A0AAV1R753_9ROSI|nr:unnamed protein product [Dovyalis caffra]